MKKKISILGIIVLSGLTLLSCSKKEDVSKSSDENIVSKDVYGSNDGEVIKLASCELYFKKNSEIPYLKLDDGVELMSIARSSNLNDEKYKYNLVKENNDFVISNETGTKCILNIDKQTFTFEDFDKFTSLVSEKQKPLSILSIKKDMKSIKSVNEEYTKGNEVRIDLNPYSKLDLFINNESCYMPLSVYNSILFNNNINTSLAYNGNSLFLIPSGGLSKKLFGIPIQTSLGEKFHEGAHKDSISEEMYDYYFDSLCLDFNNQYGLKEKFNDFKEFLESKSLSKNNKILNPKELDNYTGSALTYLNDGHTALTEFSNLYEFGDGNVDKDRSNPVKAHYDECNDAFVKSKKTANIKDGLDYKDDTVFVTFENFTNIDEDLLYLDSINNDSLDNIPSFDFSFGEQNPLLENTAILFNKLYKDLKSDTYKNSIKNIVIDLTANEGGAADGLIYALSTLIGNVTIDMTNPLSNGHNHQTYMADINLDGRIDEKDESLSSLGFKIYFLNSKYSFSSANAMPVIAKLNNSNVTNLGDKTAGGPCAVRTNVTPIGSMISSSSLSVISKKDGNKYVNIDGGIEADYVLTEDKMIDRDYIRQVITWISK